MLVEGKGNLWNSKLDGNLEWMEMSGVNDCDDSILTSGLPFATVAAARPSCQTCGSWPTLATPPTGTVPSSPTGRASP